MNEEKPLLPSVYLGNIRYYTLLLHYPEVNIAWHEHFVKQTYRSRCTIYGANGPLDLIIPLKKWNNNTPVKEIRISYDSPWQQLHWKSLEAAYRSSPYFEFYEDELLPFYEQQDHHSLVDFNAALQDLILRLLEIGTRTVPTNAYEPPLKKENNFLGEFSPKKAKVYNFPEYSQVFENKHGFLENLSIIDLLFNKGPEAGSYLKSCICCLFPNRIL